MILLPTPSVIRYDTETGAGSGLLISILEELSLFLFDWSNNFDAIDVKGGWFCF